MATYRSDKLPNTGFRTCDCCGSSYDYAPDSPPHICLAKCRVKGSYCETHLQFFEDCGRAQQPK
jgi:hypothetical protein